MISKIIIILSLEVHVLKDDFMTLFSQVDLSPGVGDHIILKWKSFIYAYK